jgi:predicted extracellular nuclease
MAGYNIFRPALLALGMLAADVTAASQIDTRGTVLNAGDIAIVGMNFDGTDAFAFVALADIPGSVQINFSDNGWFTSPAPGSFRTGEGQVTWTAPASGVSAGTVVRIEVAAPTTTLGTVAASSGFSVPNFSGSGDQVLAFLGTASSPFFLYAANNDGPGEWATTATSSNDSGLPATLTNGATAVALDEIDNSAYTGPTSGSSAQLLAEISNKANWTGDDANPVSFPAAFTITNTPALSIADLTQVEGNSGTSSFEFSVTLSSPAPAGGVSFQATTTDGTATAGSDYVALSAAPFSIAEGLSSATVTVTVNGDTVDESDETFTVTLSAVTGATVADGEATGTITNDDAATAELSIANPADIAEGNSGETDLDFTVSLAFAVGEDVSFTATTADGSATAGADYAAVNGEVFTITAGNTSVQVPVAILGDTVDEADETFTLTIASSSPAVTLGNATATATILDDDLPTTEIFTIQGSGVCTSFVATCNLGANVAGNPVRTAQNVVTAVGPSGFFIQTPDARDDNNPITSNGIYVFTAGAPATDLDQPIQVGDELDVTGSAAEFFGFTQISVNSSRDPANTIVRTGSEQPLPGVVIFGSVSKAGVPVEIPSRDPDNLSCGALGNFECFEGMRVSMPNGRVSVSNQRFSSDLYAEVYVSPFGERGLREKGARFGNTLVPANLGAGIWDGNPEILELDADTLVPANAGLELAGGTRFSAEGVIGFDFGDYELWATDLAIDPETNETVRPVPATKGELTIGSFNAFRLCDALQNSPSNCAATTALETDANRVIHQLGQVSAYIREVLRSPDVVGMQEVENLDILQQLATQISNDGGPAYEAYLVEGNDVGGIDVGYLVNPARTANVTVTQLAATETWNDPSNGAGTILHDRPPLLLAADFTEGGRQWRFHVINNHTRSRGGVDVSNAEGERTRAKRFIQAVSIANIVQGLQTDPGTASIPLMVIGDHNAYQFTDAYADVVGLIAGTYDNAENTCAPQNSVTNCELPGGANIVVPAMINAVDVINEDERYSYKFTENFGAVQGANTRDVATNQVLDHALFNQVAAPFVTGFAYGRANVDASAQRFRVCNYTNRDNALCPQGPGAWVPTGSSDHDGFVLVLQPPLPDAIFADGFED